MLLELELQQSSGNLNKDCQNLMTALPDPGLRKAKII